MVPFAAQLDIPHLNALCQQIDRLVDRLDTLNGHLTEVEFVGEKLMDILDPVLAKIASTMQTLAEEVVQIREKLAQSTTPAQLQAVLDNLDALETQIREVIPDEVPPEEPPADAGAAT